MLLSMKIIQSKNKEFGNFAALASKTVLKIHTILFQIIDDYGLEASFNITPYIHNFTAGKSNFYSSEWRYLERRWKTTTSVLHVMTSKTSENGA